MYAFEHLHINIIYNDIKSESLLKPCKKENKNYLENIP